MIKRMIIMLMRWAWCWAACFGFQVFKANIIKRSWPAGQSAADGVHDHRWLAGMAAACRRGRQHPRGERRRFVAGGGGHGDEIDFKSGDDVQPGQVLLRLRSDDDIGEAASLEATAELAQVNYDRDLKQFQAQAISQATVDTEPFNLKNARAQVAEQQAMVDKKILRAPFAGHLGIRAVDLGQYLECGHNGGDAAGAGSALRRFLPAAAGAGPDQGRADGCREGRHLSGPDFPGKIVAINPQVDPTSRNVQMRATLGNPDHRLLPGMYATIGHRRRRAPASTSPCRRPRSRIIRTAARCIRASTRATEAQGKPQLVAQQTFVTTGDDARRPGGGAERREGGRRRRHRRADQAAQRLRRSMVEQQRCSRGQSASEPPPRPIRGSAA